MDIFLSHEHADTAVSEEKGPFLVKLPTYRGG